MRGLCRRKKTREDVLRLSSFVYILWGACLIKGTKIITR